MCICFWKQSSSFVIWITATVTRLSFCPVLRSDLEDYPLFPPFMSGATVVSTTFTNLTLSAWRYLDWPYCSKYQLHLCGSAACSAFALFLKWCYSLLSYMNFFQCCSRCALSECARGTPGLFGGLGGAFTSVYAVASVHKWWGWERGGGECSVYESLLGSKVARGGLLSFYSVLHKHHNQRVLILMLCFTSLVQTALSLPVGAFSRVYTRAGSVIAQVPVLIQARL